MATETGENKYEKYGQPTLDLVFTGEKKSLTDRVGNVAVGFARTSTATYFGSDGLIKTAAVDEARFDHDPTTGESLGLLIEESRRNYSPNVYGFTGNGSTSKELYGYTLPDGTVGRLKYHAYITSSSYEIYQGVDAVGGVGVNHVLSYYVRNISGYTVSFRYGSSGQTATIPDDGKWYRLVVDNYVGNVLNRIYNMYLCTSGGSATDPSVSGPMELLFWGENIEAGSFVTSYIPTPYTFTSRASTATYYDQNGIVSIAATDVARSDAYFPDENGVFKPAGLLLEEARTNLQLNSAAPYTTGGVNVTLTSNHVAPDNTATAVLYTENTSTSEHYHQENIFPSPAFAAGTYTFSVFIKSNGSNRVSIKGPATETVTFDLSTVSVVSFSTGGSTASITNAGNGWFRCSVTRTVASSITFYQYYAGLNSDTGAWFESYTGDGTSGAYFWGWQIEASPYPTSYIPTSGTTATRAADISSSGISTRAADTASISNAINTDEFTIVNKPFGSATGSDTFKILGAGSSPVKRTTVYRRNLNQSEINYLAGKTDDFWRWRVLGSSFALPNFSTDGQVTVDWGDGTVETLTTSTHTFSNGGGYHDIGFRLDSGTYFRPYINSNATEAPKVVALGPAPASMKLYGLAGFRGCSNLKAFDATLDATGGSSLAGAWYDCSSLKNFPLINISSVTDLTDAWRGCTGLTSFPLLDTSSAIYFNQAWLGCTGLTSFPQLDTSSATRFDNTWNGCTGLTSFPLLDTSSVTNFSSAWRDCNSLTSFPLIDTSAATNFSSTWYGCGGLTSFPALNTSNVTDFYTAWFGCGSLTSFPVINTSQATSVAYAWYACSSLTSFPSLDFSNVTTFLYAWLYCTNLANIPAGLFDTTTATNFTLAFGGCALTAQSVENILVSIDTAGQSNGTLGISGGTSAGYSTWSATAQTALSNLQGKGWTVSYNP